MQGAKKPIKISLYVCNCPFVCATLTTHFLFIPSSNASFLFPLDLYKNILPTLQIFEFNEEEQEDQFLQKKKLKNLMAAPEKSYGTLKCSREIVICQPNSKFLKAKDST